jgi:hypothetical protein
MFYATEWLTNWLGKDPWLNLSIAKWGIATNPI